MDVKEKSSQTEASYLRDKETEIDKIHDPNETTDNAKPSQTNASYLSNKTRKVELVDEEAETSDQAIKAEPITDDYNKNNDQTITDDNNKRRSTPAQILENFNYPTQFNATDKDSKTLTCNCRLRLMQNENGSGTCRNGVLSSEEEVEKEQKFQEYPCICPKDPTTQTENVICNASEKSKISDPNENLEPPPKICHTNIEETEDGPQSSCVCKIKPLSETCVGGKNREMPTQPSASATCAMPEKELTCKYCGMKNVPQSTCLKKGHLSVPSNEKSKKHRSSTTSEIMVLSAKDIKTRGGFKKKSQNVSRTPSWYTFAPSASNTSTKNLASTTKMKSSSVKCPSCSQNIQEEEYFSCETSSDTCIVCKCFPGKTCQETKLHAYHSVQAVRIELKSSALDPQKSVPMIGPCGVCVGEGEGGTEEFEEETNIEIEEEQLPIEEEVLSCYCSTQTILCHEDPDAPCQTVVARKERIVQLLDTLTDLRTCTEDMKKQRPDFIKKLFKEITVLLCKDICRVDAKKPKGDKSKEDDEMAEQPASDDTPHEQKEHKPNPKLQKCFENIENLIQECFLKKEKPVVEIYNVERDSDYGKYGPIDDELMVDEENPEEEMEVCDPCEALKLIKLELMEAEEESDLYKKGAETDTDVCAGICQPYHGDECDCCHCRALRDDECQTVKRTIESGTCDPTCEMKYFIDSIIFDLDAMDHVLHGNDTKPKSEKSRPMQPPCSSFPVCITDVRTLGDRSLFVRWDVLDCCGIAGYEIYVDGHLTNRYYSPNHESAVICDIDIDKVHQIVLRAHPVGEDFVGDSCSCVKTPTNTPPPGCDSMPWTPSIYFYDPYALV